MLKVKEKGLLLNIIKHCERINQKIINVSKEEFKQNQDLREIVALNLIQIGELVHLFDADFIKKYDAMKWHQIRGIRNHVVHGYDTIEIDVIWDTITKDIGFLLNYCHEILCLNDESK